MIKPPVTPIGQNNPLNFIYGNEINFLQSVIVASPVYAVNDLRLQNSSTISEWIGNVAGHPNKVAVGGNFYEEQNAEQGRARQRHRQPGERPRRDVRPGPVLDEGQHRHAARLCLGTAPIRSGRRRTAT